MASKRREKHPPEQFIQSYDVPGRPAGIYEWRWERGGGALGVGYGYRAHAIHVFTPEERHAGFGPAFERSGVRGHRGRPRAEAGIGRPSRDASGATVHPRDRLKRKKVGIQVEREDQDTDDFLGAPFRSQRLRSTRTLYDLFKRVYSPDTVRYNVGVYGVWSYDIVDEQSHDTGYAGYGGKGGHVSIQTEIEGVNVYEGWKAVQVLADNVWQEFGINIDDDPNLPKWDNANLVQTLNQHPTFGDLSEVYGLYVEPVA